MTIYSTKWFKDELYACGGWDYSGNDSELFSFVVSFKLTADGAGYEQSKFWIDKQAYDYKSNSFRDLAFYRTLG